MQHPNNPQTHISHYAVPPETWVEGQTNHILLSYLDVVVQGYLREFGEDGARRFFETTDGWNVPVLDDRAAPLYPRHCTLTPQERAFVDDSLAELSAQVEQP